MDKKAYEAPALRTIGTVYELTQQDLDKVGSSEDFLTAIIPALDGKVIPD
jgi:hypothetical protein